MCFHLQMEPESQTYIADIAKITYLCSKSWWPVKNHLVLDLGCTLLQDFQTFQFQKLRFFGHSGRQKKKE